MSSRSKSSKISWPTKDVMKQIYDQSLWGGKEFDFYSGIGSHDPMMVNIYVKTVTDFLKSHDHKMTICDIGCGDFNIGKHLTKYSKKYIAIDIVENLTKRNKNLYKDHNLEFYCLDIINDKLPSGDCIILRQVLQHLSNKDIEKVIKKITVYKYIILTEHIPLGNFVSNKDIISGQGIRLKQNSGVNILEAPFNLKIKDQKQLEEHILENNKGRILTTLFKVF